MLRCPNKECETRSAEPKYGAGDGWFRIAGHSNFEVCADGCGAEQTGDIEWDDDSFCMCLWCDHEGVVKDFEVEEDVVSDAVAGEPTIKTHYACAGTCGWLGENLNPATGTAQDECPFCGSPTVKVAKPIRFRGFTIIQVETEDGAFYDAARTEAFAFDTETATDAGLELRALDQNNQASFLPEFASSAYARVEEAEDA